MKTKITVLLFFMTTIFFSQNKYSKVYYKKKSILNIDKKNDNVDKLLNETFSKMNDLEYILEFNESISLFKENESMNVGNSGSSLTAKLSKIMGISCSGQISFSMLVIRVYHLYAPWKQL